MGSFSVSVSLQWMLGETFTKKSVSKKDEAAKVTNIIV